VRRAARSDRRDADRGSQAGDLMAIRPKELLERARGETFLSEDEDEMSITFHPGLDDRAIAEIEATVGAPLPDAIDELLRFTSRIEFGSHELSFVPDFSFGMEEILPRVSELMPDGFGNSWLIEIGEDGAWGPVFYACHDPPVLVIQSADLGTFLDEVLSMGRPDRRSLLDFVHDEAAGRVYASDDDGRPAHALANDPDPALREFASTLEPDDMVFDLRARACGTGLAWGRHSSEPKLRRHGAELIFAVETPAAPRGLWSRLRGVFRR